MISRILSFLIRCGITGILGLAVGFSIGGTGAFVIWISGGVYALVKFNDYFDFVALTTDKIENKINAVANENSKKKIESDMLRLKNLHDNGILTQDEYDQKIKILKDKYLS